MSLKREKTSGFELGSIASNACGLTIYTTETDVKHASFFSVYYPNHTLVGGVSQVTFIYIALLTIQMVSKHLTVSSWRIECQQCIIIRLSTQFSVKGISLLNSEMSLSSSV